MEVEYYRDLESNDKEDKLGLSWNKENQNNIIEEPPVVYNPNSFQAEFILNYLKNKGLLKINQYCPHCHKEMNICKQSSTIDRVVWRCYQRNPPHDIKKNIGT